MNLFRSKEHVTGWELYNPESYEVITPIRNWATAVGAGLFSRRLGADYLDRITEHFDDFFDRLGALGRTGRFWRLPTDERTGHII